ncbi:MAG: MJ0042-type zinc finger domain-containing protein, partial [Spirochaetota bacterium]
MTPAVTSQSIATQCNSCSHTFTVNREEIRSSPDGITQCPSCRTPIKFAFCPQCNISYSIVMKNLPPNRYATTCKRCGEQFTITIPSLTPSRNTKPPFIEKVTVPVRNRVTAERPHAPAPERETGHRQERTEEHRSTGYAA